MMSVIEKGEIKMKMNLQDIWIDRVGLAAIVIVSLGYVLFGASFAQLRLEFSFLNFPIFIGEILLGLTSLLFIVKSVVLMPDTHSSSRQKWELGRWGWILGAYLFFILLKAFCGYHAWGPLAFRDAALFYYPFFAVFGYSFWSQDLLMDKTRRLGLAVIFFIFILHQYALFWPCSLIIIGVILALEAKSFKERMVLIGAVFLFAPYDALFNIFYRAAFLSSLITAIFIGVIFFLFFCNDRRVRIVGIVLVSIVLGIFLFKFGQTGIGRTFVIKDVKPLPAALTQELPRGKCLFQPVGSFSKKPDTIKEFSQKMSGGSFLIVKNPAVEEKKAVVEEKKAVVEEKKAAVEEKKAAVEEKKTAVEEKKPAVEEKKPAVEMDNDILKTKRDDVLFRYYIWRDMAHEYARYKPPFGFSFGRPLYSPTLLKYWGAATQDKDGWVGAHNSFLYMIYRAGIIGLFMIFALLFIWFGLLRDFYIFRDWTGILLCAVLLNWIVSANFFLIFELPYTAIPVWTILGVTVKHRMLLKKVLKSKI
jgi:hypothetical protein